MTLTFDTQIQEALGRDLPADVPVTQTGIAELSSCFAVTDLAVASVKAAVAEAASAMAAQSCAVDRRLTALWFDRTLHPQGWALPSAWGALAGDYAASDGWIRLHTNASHHRAAALAVLGCEATKEAVTQAVADWSANALETAVVEAGGAAAAMRSLADWRAHPQGHAVAREPLIHWERAGDAAPPIPLHGLKVLDLTRVLAGPVATRFLAGFGARVLRIDPPGWHEPGVEPEVTLGKRRAGLDLTQREDRKRFEALVTQADVIVHGYRHGALMGLGYGPSRLRGFAPRHINVCLNAYGWTGPWRDRRGFDSLVQLSSGIAAEGMDRAQSPCPVSLPVQALDHATGYLMAAAVLRALRIRNATGKVIAARLSLARTAALLVSAGSSSFEHTTLKTKTSDLSLDLEQTDWGPARRVHPPMSIDGRGPSWPFPAGRLRVDPAAWQV